MQTIAPSQPPAPVAPQRRIADFSFASKAATTQAAVVIPADAAPGRSRVVGQVGEDPRRVLHEAVGLLRDVHASAELRTAAPRGGVSSVFGGGREISSYSYDGLGNAVAVVREGANLVAHVTTVPDLPGRVSGKSGQEAMRFPEIANTTVSSIAPEVELLVAQDTPYQGHQRNTFSPLFQLRPDASAKGSQAFQPVTSADRVAAGLATGDVARSPWSSRSWVPWDRSINMDSPPRVFGVEMEAVPELHPTRDTAEQQARAEAGRGVVATFEVAGGFVNAPLDQAVYRSGAGGYMPDGGVKLDQLELAKPVYNGQGSSGTLMPIVSASDSKATRAIDVPVAAPGA